MLQVCTYSASQNVQNGMFEVTKIMINQSAFIIFLKEVMSQHTMRSIYFSNVHSHLMCGLGFFCGGVGSVPELTAAINSRRGLYE